MLPIPLAAAPYGAEVLARIYLKLEQAMGRADRAPALIVAMPPVWANKYQLLLYGRASAEGMAVCGARTPDDLDRVFWPGPVILHAHWFDPIFSQACDETEAGEMFEAAFEKIAAFRARTGAKLLWTAHNVFPHDSQFPETFLELRRRVFREFDAIHVMHESHVAQLEEAFGEQAPPHFTVPHMTYRGIIPDTIDRDAARAHYGIGPEAFVFGLFGALQKYKGSELFLDALALLREQVPGRETKAIIAGAPADDKLARRLIARAEQMGGVHVDARKLFDHEVQYPHRASNVMVLPYQQTLNSGAAMMALSFERPFIAPAAPALDDLRECGAIGADTRSAERLCEAMRGCLEGADGPPAVLGDRLAPFDPDVISRQFFERLDTALLRPRPSFPWIVAPDMAFV